MNTSNEPHKPVILVVDDAPDNLTLMSALLKDQYKVKIANSGERCLKVAHADARPDLILLDVMMPEMDGYETCRQLKADAKTRDIPIIFLTAKSEVDDETKGLELGAVDYITKPISPPIVLARIKTHLGMKLMQDFLRDQNVFLEMEVKKRTDEIIAIQDVTIQAMASLAEKLRFNPRFAHFLNDDKIIDILFKSAPLHDIGKVGIPDRILLKPGRFEAAEFEIMKTHTTLGRDAISQAEHELGIEVPFLKYAKEIAYGHQEKWDGSGYPQGLAGDAIPISARLMAVADVYDALISLRVYKQGMPHEKAAQIIIDGKGSHFDPDMVDAFLALQDEFQAIAARYADDHLDMQKKADYLEQAIGE